MRLGFGKNSGKFYVAIDSNAIQHCRIQWRSEGIWRPGTNLNFAPPPPSKKIIKNDNKMSTIQLVMCIKSA